MKSIQMRPLAVLTIAVVTIAGTTLLSARQVQQRDAQLAANERVSGYPLTISGPVRVEGIPTADRMRMVFENAPFTVPAGSIYVVTGIGATSIGASVADDDVFVETDGVQVLQEELDGQDGLPNRISLPPGLTAAAGSEIAVRSAETSTSAILFGYLADA